jgi:hypothetical protein
MEAISNQSKHMKQHFQEWQKHEDKFLLQSGKRWMQGSLPKNTLREADGSSIQFRADSQNYHVKVGLREPTEPETNQQYGGQPNEIIFN